MTVNDKDHRNSLSTDLLTQGDHITCTCTEAVHYWAAVFHPHL